MKYAYDLHIHSCLSACADDLMSPNNIFNMANLKKLNIISITDHNTTKHMPIYQELSESYDMLFIPGVEITVKEGFHVLCYFKSFSDAITFDQVLEQNSIRRPYDKETYGYQQIMNIYDEEIDQVDYLLSAPLKLSLTDLMEALKPYEHILIYAHIDRDRQSGLPFIHQIKLHGVELSSHVDSNFTSKHNLHDYLILNNSDAHQIIDILEPSIKNQMTLESLNIDAFFRYFNHG
jgi:PHP family Zn ribbon phosphoesterase